MHIGFKKLLLTLFFATALVIGFNGNKAFAAAPTMDWNWGFAKGTAQNVQTRYWQYGNMSWSSAIQYASSQLHASPALVSISVSDSYAYNDCRIRVSSNYWQNVGWAGITTKVSSTIYTCDLNSTNVSTDAQRQKVATHEICHAFGLNDCTSSEYLMYQYVGTVYWITSYENNMFVNRYN